MSKIDVAEKYIKLYDGLKGEKKEVWGEIVSGLAALKMMVGLRTGYEIPGFVFEDILDNVQKLLGTKAKAKKADKKKKR